MNEEATNWLLQSDPSVIFQTMRDILNLPKKEWKPFQEQISLSGWGKRLLDLQDPDGRWGGGLYGPKFISTHYTLMLLRRMEMVPNDSTGRGCDKLIEIEAIGSTDPTAERQDACITGMGLNVLAHFKSHPEIYDDIIQSLQHRQLEDGGWNCRHPRIKVKHSSVHTTLLVLEGLASLSSNYPQYKSKMNDLSDPAHEFLLAHELYKSHRTKQVMHEQFIDITFPPRWKYNILSCLDYFQSRGLQYDERMKDAIDIIISKGKAGFWGKGTQMSGKIFFRFEQPRQPSEFNTLRALRVLKQYQ